MSAGIAAARPLPPRRVVARAGYHRVDCQPGETVEVIVGTAPRTGGLDVCGQGGSVVIRDGDLGGWRLNIGGTFNRVDVLGVRSDVGQGDERDVLNVSGTIDTLVIDRCRFTGVHGHQLGTHGDGVQVLKGASVRFLVLRRSTFGSAYQVLMVALTAAGVGVQRVLIDRCNIRDEAKLRVQQSVAVLLDGCAQRGMALEIRDSWLEWPGGLSHAVWTNGRVSVAGAFQQGVPPGGDVCP